MEQGSGPCHHDPRTQDGPYPHLPESTQRLSHGHHAPAFEPQQPGPPHHPLRHWASLPALHHRRLPGIEQQLYLTGRSFPVAHFRTATEKSRALHQSVKKSNAMLSVKTSLDRIRGSPKLGGAVQAVQTDPAAVSMPQRCGLSQSDSSFLLKTRHCPYCICLAQPS